MRSISSARSRLSRSGLGALTTSIVVVVAAVAAMFVRAEPAGAQVYTYALEAGQSRVYAMSMQVSMRPTDAPGFEEPVDETITGTMRMKVVEVAADGSALIELTLTSDDGDAPDEPLRMRVSKTGEILSIDGAGLPGLDLSGFMGGGASGSSLGSMSLFPVYPSDAIAPGDTWSEDQKIDLPFGDGAMRVSTSGRHDGFEQTDYGRAARVKMTFASPIDLTFTFADLISMLADAFAGSGAPGGFSSSPGAASPFGGGLPAGIERVRMVIDGRVDGDMVARAVPETGDLVGMQMDMRIDMAMRIENLPQEMAGLLSGMPSTIDMVGDMRMTLDRIG